MTKKSRPKGRKYPQSRSAAGREVHALNGVDLEIEQGSRRVDWTIGMRGSRLFFKMMAGLMESDCWKLYAGNSRIDQESRQIFYMYFSEYYTFVVSVETVLEATCLSALNTRKRCHQ